MEFKFINTEQDQLEFNKYYYNNTEKGKKIVLKTRITFFLVFFFLGLIFLIFGYNLYYIVAVFFILFGIIFSIIYPWILLNGIKNQLKKMSKSSEAFLGKEITAIIGEKSITEIVKGIKTEIQYENFIKAYSAEYAAYIFYEENRAFFLPNRVFANAQSKLSLVNEINSRIEAAKSSQFTQ